MKTTKRTTPPQIGLSALQLNLGDWGSIYTLQRSLDLNHWSEFQQITNSAGVTRLAITNSALAAPVFLRAASK